MDYLAFNTLWENTVMWLYKSGTTVTPRGLECKEEINADLTLVNPRQRLIYSKERKMSPFYCIGELIWYLSGSNRLEDIEQYSKFWKNCSDDGVTLNSAYGHRIFTGDHESIPFNQYKHVLSLLKNDPYSRQAIIHFKTPSDVKTKDEVCTLSMQFFVRDNKLHTITTMRSNDVIWGTSYDVYFFTILQEMLALELEVELGNYHHNVGSLHLYKKDYKIAKKLSGKRSNVVNPVQHEKLTKEFLNNIPELVRVVKLIEKEQVSIDEEVLSLYDSFSRNILVITALHKFYKQKDMSNYIRVRTQYDTHIQEAYKILLEPFDEEIQCMSK